MSAPAKPLAERLRLLDRLYRERLFRPVSTGASPQQDEPPKERRTTP